MGRGGRKRPWRDGGEATARNTAATGHSGPTRRSQCSGLRRQAGNEAHLGADKCRPEAGLEYSQQKPGERQKTEERGLGRGKRRREEACAPAGRKRSSYRTTSLESEAHRDPGRAQPGGKAPAGPSARTLAGAPRASATQGPGTGCTARCTFASRPLTAVRRTNGPAGRGHASLTGLVLSHLTLTLGVLEK